MADFTIDILLGVDVFVAVLLHGRRTGPPGSPVAFETHFGWYWQAVPTLVHPLLRLLPIMHASFVTGDNLLRQFWKVED